MSWGNGKIVIWSVSYLNTLYFIWCVIYIANVYFFEVNLKNNDH